MQNSGNILVNIMRQSVQTISYEQITRRDSKKNIKICASRPSRMIYPTCNKKHNRYVCGLQQSLLKLISTEVVLDTE